MHLFVTGATGFIGSALISALATNDHYFLRACVRRPDTSLPDKVDVITVTDLANQIDWMTALEGIDVLVHTAARVHVMTDKSTDPLAEFRRVNVEGTLNLARQAADAGVRRFIFISSIKVNGEETWPGRPFTADDAPKPLDPYGISKHEAEQGLQALAKETGMEVVIIRPVLVYGPGVKANFQSMMRWLDNGVPLPLGAITGNRRSMVALDNLIDLIITCLRHPAAANQIFLVSDGEDLSTAALLQRTANALKKPARLFPVPSTLLNTAARILGKAVIAQRLCGSLQVDVSKTFSLLAWRPPVNVDTALQKTAQQFQQQRQ